MQKRRKILIILAAALLPALTLLWSFTDMAADRLFSRRRITQRTSPKTKG